MNKTLIIMVCESTHSIIVMDSDPYPPNSAGLVRKT